MKRSFAYYFWFLGQLWRLPLELISVWLYKRDRFTKEFRGIWVCAPSMLERQFTETISALEFIEANFPDYFLSLKENVPMISFTSVKRNVYSFSPFKEILTLDVNYIPLENSEMKIARILLTSAIFIEVLKKNKIPRTKNNAARVSKASIRRQKQLFRIMAGSNKQNNGRAN